MGETQNYSAETSSRQGHHTLITAGGVTPLLQNNGLTTELREDKLWTSLAATSQMIPNCGILDFQPICHGNSKQVTVASKWASRNDF